MIDWRYYKRRMAIITDLHCGSRFAPWPEKFYTEEGVHLGPSVAQIVLNEALEDFGRIVRDWKVDTVICAGDMCDGGNVKEGGKDLVTVLFNEQIKAAVRLLEPIVKGRILRMISGSGYHQSRDFRIHEALVTALKGKFDGQLAHYNLKETDRKMQVNHGAGGGLQFKATGLERESMWQLMAQALDKLEKFDIVVNGHLHCFRHLHMPHQHLVLCPGWKAYHPNKITAKSVGKNIMIDIGGVLIMIDRDDRINVWHYLYKAPKIADRMRRI